MATFASHKTENQCNIHKQVMLDDDYQIFKLLNEPRVPAVDYWYQSCKSASGHYAQPRPCQLLELVFNLMLILTRSLPLNLISIAATRLSFLSYCTIDKVSVCTVSSDETTHPSLHALSTSCILDLTAWAQTRGHVSNGT